MNIIAPRSGTAFILKKGDRLTVTDIQGEQVSDFICFNLNDTKEYLSSGRTIDYAETIFLTKGKSVLFKPEQCDVSHSGGYGGATRLSAYSLQC